VVRELIRMEVLYERVAWPGYRQGLGTVCVRRPGARRGAGVRTSRTFKTTTGSLGVMPDWLVEEAMTIAAMESTSTYRKRSSTAWAEVMTVSVG
jgi:transposase